MEFNFDFEMTKENKKMIEELLKQKGVKHYVLETKDKEKLNLVEYKDYEELEKENQKLKEKLQSISNEFLKYDWKTSNKEQIINQLENLYNSIFRE